MPIKVMSIFGTRPEAIKLAPVIKHLEKDSRFQSSVVVSGQHRGSGLGLLSNYARL